MNMIIAEAEKLKIQFACHFEAVNESAIAVKKDRAILTPLGRAIALASKHANGRIMYTSHTCVVTENNGTYVATMVNPSFRSEKTVELSNNVDILEICGYSSKDVFPNTNFDEYKPTVTDGKITLAPHSIAIVYMK